MPRATLLAWMVVAPVLSMATSPLIATDVATFELLPTRIFPLDKLANLLKAIAAELLMSALTISLSVISLESISVPRVAATVTVSVAPPVVVIPVPAAIVKVSPELIVWLVPEVPASVKRPLPDEVTHVEQVKTPVVVSRLKGDEAETAKVPVVVGNVNVTSELRLEGGERLTMLLPDEGASLSALPPDRRRSSESTKSPVEAP